MSEALKNFIKIVFRISLLIIIIITGPLLVIFAINTLFPHLIIDYTVKTWFATMILILLLRSPPPKR